MDFFECCRHLQHASNTSNKTKHLFHKDLWFGTVELKRYDSQNKLI